MTFDEWWDANDMDSDPDANYTVSEVVWKAAQKDLLSDVLKIISHHPDLSVSNLTQVFERILGSPAMS